MKSNKWAIEILHHPDQLIDVHLSQPGDLTSAKGSKDFSDETPLHVDDRMILANNEATHKLHAQVSKDLGKKRYNACERKIRELGPSPIYFLLASAYSAHNLTQKVLVQNVQHKITTIELDKK
jgi:hypothetical protein